MCAADRAFEGLHRGAGLLSARLPERSQASGPSVFDRSRNQSVQIIVRDNNVDQALKALKKKMQREGLLAAPAKK